MRTIAKTVALAGAALIAAGTAASAMGLSFDWADTKKCFDPKSPPFTLSGVPKETKKLRFRMVDFQAPNYNHGGGTIKYTGTNKIARGAFRYKGPCPPSGSHTYQWTVEALGDGGKVLATAKAKRKFP